MIASFSFAREIPKFLKLETTEIANLYNTSVYLSM
jgi:hypothetical protein